MARGNRIRDARTEEMADGRTDRREDGQTRMGGRAAKGPLYITNTYLDILIPFPHPHAYRKKRVVWLGSSLRLDPIFLDDRKVDKDFKAEVFQEGAQSFHDASIPLQFKA